MSEVWQADQWEHYLPDILARVDRGESLRSIGQLYGVSHERIRQVIPDGYASKTRNHERLMLARLVERLERAKPCAICGCWVLVGGPKGRRQTCSERCATMLSTTAAHYRLYPAFRQGHQLRMARYILRTGNGSTTWARNKLAGTARTYRSKYSGLP